MNVRGVPAVGLLLGGSVVVLLEALAGGQLIDHPVVLLLAALAGAWCGAACPVRWAAVSVPLAAVALTVGNQALAGDDFHPADDLVFFLTITGAPALAGAGLAARRRQVRELTALTARLVDQREDVVRTAMLTERNRIEADLHREISEQLAAVVLRAQGGQRATSSAALQQSLSDIEATARLSLDRLRDTLGTLRDAPSRSTIEPPVLRPRAIRPSPGDAAVALACGAAVALEVVVRESLRGPVWANVVAALALAAPLCWRRTRPLGVAVVFAVGAVVTSAVLTPITVLVTTIAPLLAVASSIGAHSRRWPLGVLAVAAGLVGADLASPPGVGGAALLPTLGLTALAVMAGLVAAGSIRRADELRAGVRELESARAIAVELAVAQQRAHVAQDLHDTVAHAMTVVCLQASAARRTTHPDAFDTIIETARAGLAELRSGLDTLDLSTTDAIRARARQLGLAPSVVMDADLGALDDAVSTLAFRVVREALVNASRYAPGSRVEVRVSRLGEQLTVSVVDDGGAGGFEHGAGSGLAGLADQLAATGGRLEWGRVERGGPGSGGLCSGERGHGFAVRATLPVWEMVGR